MKYLFFLLVGIGVSACSAITADPWGWLDQPEQQDWALVAINGPGREVVFSVPDRLNSGGEHVRRWPRLEKGHSKQIIDLPAESLDEPYHRILHFEWEWYWGGFYKPGESDFYLEISLLRTDKPGGLLDLDIDERIQRQQEYYVDLFEGDAQEVILQREWFFNNYWVKPYESAASLLWVNENQPQVIADHRYFIIPISDYHELSFLFFVREDRQTGPADPEWMARRWELAREIIDTVTITPNPY